jgi:hypothetical protein
MRRDATESWPRRAPLRPTMPAGVSPGWYSRAVDAAFTKEGWFPPESTAPRGGYVELRCPDCQSAELKRVSLVYQEGLAHIKTRSRFLGFVFGENSPNLVTGRAVMRGVQQTELSKILNPPVKWSYLRLIFRAVILTFVALAAYIVFVASSTPPVSTIPLKLYVFLAPVVFLVLAFAVWRYNHLVYPLQYAQWDRSFLCQRCGVVSFHDGPPVSGRKPYSAPEVRKHRS